MNENRKKKKKCKFCKQRFQFCLRKQQTILIGKIVTNFISVYFSLAMLFAKSQFEISDAKAKQFTYID